MLHIVSSCFSALALGDQEMLECLKRKLDGYFKINVSDKVNKFLKYGNKICNEYNTEFVPRLIGKLFEEAIISFICEFNHTFLAPLCKWFYSQSQS